MQKENRMKTNYYSQCSLILFFTLLTFCIIIRTHFIKLKKNNPQMKIKYILPVNYDNY